MNEADLEAYRRSRADVLERAANPPPPMPRARCRWCGTPRWTDADRCGHCGHYHESDDG